MFSGQAYTIHLNGWYDIGIILIIRSPQPIRHDPERRTIMAFTVLSDAPTAWDELGREAYVLALRDRILVAETPLVTAIYGGWGSGKTSMMLQLRESLQHPRAGATEPAVRTVWFEPWTHESDANPVLALLHKTVVDLGMQRKRAVRTALKNIGLALVNDVQIPVIGIRVGKIMDAAADSDFRRQQAHAHMRQKLRSVLDAAGRRESRLVFFIDDLDRCQPAAALSVLKALRLFFNFENCIFVLGVDREPLEALLAAEYHGTGLSAESFLDKIVQLPFMIPAIEPTFQTQYIESRLSADLLTCQPLLTAATGGRPRQLKRTINMLTMCHSLVNPQMFDHGYDPRVLVALILIQDQAPRLYQVLRTSPGLIAQLIVTVRSASDSTETTSIEPSPLWVEHVGRNIGLGEALRSADLTADLDIRPYLTLASAAPGAPSSQLAPNEPLTIWSLFVDEVQPAFNRVLGSTVPPIEEMGRSAVLDGISRGLDISVWQLVVEAWAAHDEIRSALRSSATDTSSRTIVELEAERVSRRQNFRVVGTGDDHGSTEFKVETELELTPVAIIIERGTVISADGAVRISVTMARNDLIMTQHRRTVDLGSLISR